MIDQFEKIKYTEELRRIRDEYSLSLNEIAAELGMTYMAVRKLIDPECTAPIRALTVRKIKGLMNRYKEALEK